MLQIILGPYRCSTMIDRFDVRTNKQEAGHQVTAKTNSIFGNPATVTYLTLKENINKVEVLSVSRQIIVTNTVHPSKVILFCQQMFS